ncbi:MAG: ABC transporter permease [Candidatus Acidiferrales bacterium]
MNTLLQDIKYALRMLAKSPGFTVVAVLTLALGIGANTAIFSIINSVLLRNLPVKNPQQLVLFQWDADKWPPQFTMTGWQAEFAFSYPGFEKFRANSKSLSSVFAWAPIGIGDENTTVGIDGESTVANGVMVSGEYFSGLGVAPLMGRGITSNDENPEEPRVAVISYAYWTRQFARDSSIVGKHVTLNGIPFTIAGVTPPRFFGVQAGAEPDFWIAFDDQPNLRPFSQNPGGGASSIVAARNWLFLNVVGRLRDGATKAQAQSELDTLFHQVVTEEWHPENPQETPHLTLISGREGLPVLQLSTKQPLYILMFAVGLVLLIACANVATLLLARAASRQKEISVRLAIGASRSRLIRQLLTESVLLSTLGGALGLALASWGARLLVLWMTQRGSPTILDTQVDARVLLFTFAAAMLTGILFGIAPALRATRIELASAMKSSATNLSEGRDKHMLGKSLVVVQVAASLVLMISATLFLRTLLSLETRDFGFDQQNLLAFRLDPTRVGYRDARLARFYAQLLQGIQALPGVEAATVMENPPLGGWHSGSRITLEGAAGTHGTEIRWNSVGPDFFSTMRIPVILGRGIERTDALSSPAVAVVDASFAQQFFPGENPIGRRYSNGVTFDPKYAVEIVGVCKPAELTHAQSGVVPTAYISYQQRPESLNAMYFEIRTAGPPAGVISEVREAVRQADPALPLMNLKTQKEQTSEALSQQRLLARLTMIFGLLALLVAVIGLYGTMAYAVTRKTREIGIRMALGAEPARVLGMVIRQGITLAALGIAIGIVGALGAGRVIGSMIYGVTSHDPLTFLAVAALLLVVALAACYIPARRATKVDPMVALRYE